MGKLSQEVSHLRARHLQCVCETARSSYWQHGVARMQGSPAYPLSKCNSCQTLTAPLGTLVLPLPNTSIILRAVQRGSHASIHEFPGKAAVAGCPQTMRHRLERQSQRLIRLRPMASKPQCPSHLTFYQQAS